MIIKQSRSEFRKTEHVELTILLNSPVLSQFMLHSPCDTQGTMSHLPIMPLKPKQVNKTKTSVTEPTKLIIHRTKDNSIVPTIYCHKSTISSERQCKQSITKIMPIDNKLGISQPACPFYSYQGWNRRRILQKPKTIMRKVLA